MFCWASPFLFFFLSFFFSGGAPLRKKERFVEDGRYVLRKGEEGKPSLAPSQQVLVSKCRDMQNLLWHPSQPLGGLSTHTPRYRPLVQMLSTLLGSWTKSRRRFAIAAATSSTSLTPRPRRSLSTCFRLSLHRSCSSGVRPGFTIPIWRRILSSAEVVSLCQPGGLCEFNRWKMGKKCRVAL